jgi:hypothetical protein
LMRIFNCCFCSRLFEWVSEWVSWCFTPHQHLNGLFRGNLHRKNTFAD